MKKQLFILWALLFGFLPFSVSAAGDLVKTPESEAVYYVDEEKIRHAFPNRTTYESWYGSDFSMVEEISETEMAQIPLGRNVVIRPGKYLLKVPSNPEVYAVEPGGVLRRLASAGLAEKIYGLNWEYRLRDLPEVFFENYSIGQPIDFTHQIPDGVVYQYTPPHGPSSEVSGEMERYFWKNNGILEPFAGWSDVLANGYDKADVIRGDIGYFKKIKEISGRSNRIFNLSLEPNEPTSVCGAKQLRAAVIFVTKDGEASPEEVDVLQATVEGLPQSWAAATDGLSNMEVQAETFIVTDRDGELLKMNDNGRPVFNFEEMTLRFYEDAEDIYDFLIVYNDFLEPEQYLEEASYHLVHNNVKSTGRILLDRSRFHGSHGRLRGIVNMNKVSQYSVDSSAGLIRLLNLIHHEVLHHWSASISFVDHSGGRNWDLLADDKLHWSRWVNFISPLGGWGWQPVRELEEGRILYESQLPALEGGEIIAFTPLDLYLMGLIPARYMPAIGYIRPEDPDSVSDEVIGSQQLISIDNVISANGQWMCRD